MKNNEKKELKLKQNTSRNLAKEKAQLEVKKVAFNNLIKRHEDYVNKVGAERIELESRKKQLLALTHYNARVVREQRKPIVLIVAPESEKEALIQLEATLKTQLGAVITYTPSRNKELTLEIPGFFQNSIFNHLTPVKMEKNKLFALFIVAYAIAASWDPGAKPVYGKEEEELFDALEKAEFTSEELVALEPWEEHDKFTFGLYERFHEWMDKDVEEFFEEAHTGANDDDCDPLAGATNVEYDEEKVLDEMVEVI